MEISLVTSNTAVEFVKGIQDHLREAGHDVIRTTKTSVKRLNLFLDLNKQVLDKSRQFEVFKLRGVQCVPYTDNRVEATGWLLEESVVFCRTLTKANSGRGIVVATRPEELVDATLYTRYIKKKREFRVHVFKGNVIHTQEKKLRAGVDTSTVNFQIRNSDNGWVFCHKDLVIPDVDTLHSHAKLAVLACGYAFGAVDIIYNEKQNKYYVLEVNSRPAVEGTTAQMYAQEFIRLAEAGDNEPAPTNKEKFMIDMQKYLEAYKAHIEKGQ